MSNNDNPDGCPCHGVDISRILDDWEYEPQSINVRKIVGADGRPKMQVRVDLGILQMELTGRPDGTTPFARESLLQYFEGLLADHRAKTGSDGGFVLTAEQCQALREEAYMYYQRYVGLYALGELLAVARDTERNLRVLDLCGAYAEDEEDRLAMEQYRPYIIMMNTKARATIRLNHGNPATALRMVQQGLRRIKQVFQKFDRAPAYRHCPEVRTLKRLRREIRQKLPIDPRRKLERDLKHAIAEERYEDAAHLRDQLAKIADLTE